jgi:predicted porin
MKYRHFAWSVFAVACSAHAQNSVTLYGLIDAGLTYTNSSQTARPASGPVGSSQIALSDGSANGVAGSRWGLRMTEDLGGGIHTLAVLENGFSINNGALGQGGAMFGRQAFVGLTSENYGNLTLGRQYDTYTDFVQPLTSTGQWSGYMGAMPDDVDSLSNTSRINNAVKYKTPFYNGFQAAAMYSFGGVAGEFTQNQVWSIGAGYNTHSLSFAAGYINARDPNVSLYGNTPNKGLATVNNLGSFGSATTPESYPVDAGYVSASTTQIAGAAIQYALDPVVFGFVVTNARFEGLGSTQAPNPLHYTGTAFFTNFEFSVKAYLTPAFMLASAVHYTDRNSVDGDGGAKYLQLDLGTMYNLSKRTTLYLLAVMQKASGRDSLGQPAVASISGFNPSATDHQIALRLGLQQRF